MSMINIRLVFAIERRTKIPGTLQEAGAEQWKQCWFPLTSAWNSLPFPFDLASGSSLIEGPAHWLSKLCISWMLTFPQMLANWRLQFTSYFRRLFNFLSSIIVSPHAIFLSEDTEWVNQMLQQLSEVLLGYQWWGGVDFPFGFWRLKATTGIHRF